MFTVETSSAEQTRAAGRELASLLQPGDVIVLTGDLGAGKTVIAKGVAEGLGIAEPITSPTFNILLVHHGRLELAHFDLYRLESAAQLEDIDFWGVLESGAVSIVEWGDRFAGELPDDVLTVSLSITGDDSRTLALAASGPRSAALASSWKRALASSSTAGEASARG